MRPAPARAGNQPPNPVAGPPRFRTIYDEYFKFVWRSLRRLGVASAALDDATQEVFFTVYRRLPDFEGRSSLKTWLFGIVLNVSQHVNRSAARHNVDRIPPPPVPEATSTPQDELVRAEALETLYRLLDQLSSERRATFVMAELEEMSASEIAEITGLPLNTVYSRLRLSRRDFEAALKRLRVHEKWKTP
jgi:RNA polymerase sigma-70 factor (ECF subfamily)